MLLNYCPEVGRRSGAAVAEHDTRQRFSSNGRPVHRRGFSRGAEAGEDAGWGHPAHRVPKPPRISFFVGGVSTRRVFLTP